MSPHSSKHALAYPSLTRQQLCPQLPASGAEPVSPLPQENPSAWQGPRVLSQRLSRCSTTVRDAVDARARGWATPGWREPDQPLTVTGGKTRETGKDKGRASEGPDVRRRQLLRHAGPPGGSRGQQVKRAGLLPGPPRMDLRSRGGEGRPAPLLRPHLTYC